MTQYKKAHCVQCKGIVDYDEHFKMYCNGVKHDFILIHGDPSGYY